MMPGMERVLPFMPPSKITLVLTFTCLAFLSLAGSASALSFSPANNFPLGANPYSVISADFNGDGNADLACANLGSGSVSVLLGDGAGGFGPTASSAPVPVRWKHPSSRRAQR